MKLFGMYVGSASCGIGSIDKIGAPDVRFTCCAIVMRSLQQRF